MYIYVCRIIVVHLGIVVFNSSGPLTSTSLHVDRMSRFYSSV